MVKTHSILEKITGFLEVSPLDQFTLPLGHIIHAPPLEWRISNHKTWHCRVAFVLKSISISMRVATDKVALTDLRVYSTDLLRRLGSRYCELRTISSSPIQSSSDPQINFWVSGLSDAFCMSRQTDHGKESQALFRWWRNSPPLNRPISGNNFNRVFWQIYLTKPILLESKAAYNWLRVGMVRGIPWYITSLKREPQEKSYCLLSIWVKAEFKKHIAEWMAGSTEALIGRIQIQ